MLAFIHFKKPIVVAINGPALGLGASILPLCDVVWASERAWFQTPCAALHLTPSGCSSYTFPQILGVALVGPSHIKGFWQISLDLICVSPYNHVIYPVFTQIKHLDCTTSLKDFVIFSLSVSNGRPTRCCSVEENSQHKKHAVEVWCHRSSGQPHLTKK